MSAYEDNQKRLGPAFDKVAPKPHWKAEIDAWIDEADEDLVDEAVVYFCGCHIEVMERADGTYDVWAPGYWAIIGA